MILNEVPAAVWTTISAIGVAVATGLLTVWASRGKAKVDVQTVINQGFANLIEKLDKRLREEVEESRMMRDKLNRCEEENAKFREIIARRQRNDRVPRPLGDPASDW